LSDETDAQARARVGDVLNDKWTLERLLGAGGMGAVYAGRHRNGAKAAVKVLHHALSQHLEVRARFLREGYAANRVDRPGVVKVLDDDIVVGGRDDGTAYLVMELLEGQSLEGRIVSGWAITERQFLALADAVLDVLDAAHNNGVVHRDIKPDNIFIAIDDAGVERVKLLDFGLARLLEGRSTTSHGIAIGTPSFMSPEQAGGRNQEIDGRTDLFALAASGFRVITGRRIHEAVSPIEVMAKMATIPAPRIQTIAPMVSSVFARIIDRALEFNREDRYETAALMRSDVQNAMAALDMGLAVPGPPVASTGERSIELSVKDFELSKAVSVPEPIFLVPSLDLPLPPQQAVVPTEESPP
jgi:serine/threonine protein kinase